MSIVKSFSVGSGDMFYIKHDANSFTIIDCCLNEDNKNKIISEITNMSSDKLIRRFISTHPDQDHIQGLKHLDNILDIRNFYCVKNKVVKDSETDDFKHYCALRDSEKSFYLEKDCARKWLNKGDDSNGSAGLKILWPVLSDENYKNALQIAESGGSPNNISVIIRYGIKDSASILWMGDLETDFMENIPDDCTKLFKANILFAPHHGRESGRIPEKILRHINPDIIVIGEASSEDLNYYSGYNTITQNSAHDITFNCINGAVDIFSSHPDYSVDFLVKPNDRNINCPLPSDNYIGTLNLT